MKLSLSVLASLIVVPTIALADDLAPSAPAHDRSRFGLSAGLLTPTGELGAEYTWVANQHLELGLGAGVGGGWQPQVAIMPRVRMSSGHATYSLGAGLSAGRYSDYSGDFGFEYTHRTPVLWANAEAGAQRTWDDGIFARVAVGVAVAAAHGETTSSGDMSHTFSEYVLPYFGVTVGHTL
jgi:hypothetical protein